MAVARTVTSIRTLDGLFLAGTLVVPDSNPQMGTVLVHGGGVTREEGGFFTRLADGLAEAGVASLRFDLRGHGESQGRQEELTLSTILNDIKVSLAFLSRSTRARKLSLLGASFGGGICGYYAARCSDEVSRLVMLNPQLNYKKRTIDSREYWSDNFISDDAARELNKKGYIDFTPNLKHGRPILNEVFWLQPHRALGEISASTLIIHGSGDTLVPVESSREAVGQFTAPCKLVEIDGAQHGFAVHDDPLYLNRQSQKWQGYVIRTVAEWLTNDTR